jgi:hypothetical protein
MLSQVSLAVRKAAAATLPLARLMGDRSLVNVSKGELDILLRLQVSFLALIEPSPDDADSLDQFCSRQEEVFKQLVSVACKTAPAAEFSARLDGVASEIGRARCQGCRGRAASGHFACDGGVRDDDNVTGGAACLQEIFEALDFVKKLTEEQLSEAFADGQHRKLEIRLKTMFNDTGGKPLGSYASSPDGVTDVVGIFLPQRGFKFSALAQIPYTLAHEVICHATQGIENPNGAARERCGEYCPWTEGWMDCLATDVLTGSLLEDRPTAAKWMDEETSAIVNATDAAHAARLQSPSPELEFFYLQRRNAHQAWVNFLTAARKEKMFEVDAVNLRRKFCFKYNALPRPAKERSEMGTRLTLHFQLARGDQAAFDACRKFANSGRAENFCREISGLSDFLGLPSFAA